MFDDNVYFMLDTSDLFRGMSDAIAVAEDAGWPVQIRRNAANVWEACVTELVSRDELSGEKRMSVIPSGGVRIALA